MGLLDRLIRKHDTPAPAPAARLAQAAVIAPPRQTESAAPARRRAGPPDGPASADGPADRPSRSRRRRGGRRRSGRGATDRPAAQSPAPTPRDERPRDDRRRDERPRDDRRRDDRPRDDRPRDDRPRDDRPRDDRPRDDRPRDERRRDDRPRDDRPRDDRPRDDRSRDDRPRGGRRPAADRKPSFAAANATNGDRSSAAARKALSSGGYQLPPLTVVDAIDPGDYPAAFRELGLSDRALAVMASLGFDSPTPIQEQTLPLMLDGHDVVGQAQTGTGKTLAFGLVIVERLDPSLRDVQAVVLVPTRELAQQVFGVLEFLAAAMGLLAVPLMGGRRLNEDFDNLDRRPQIVVGTPGRIIDHLGRGTLDLREVRVAILDEADRMLDIGFEPDMRRILGRCPSDRQTALFSATIPTPIKTLIWRFMHEPEHVSIEPEQATPGEIHQRYYEVAEQDKLKALSELLPEMQGRTLIFCNMKVTVDRLVRRLRDRDVLAEAIHGDLDQRKRDRVMERFRAGELQFLVATNVASRGLDIPELNHVVNFDLPQNADEYVHRVGRTGRAGRQGSAVTFVCEWDYDAFDEIRTRAGDDLSRDDLALYATSR